MKSPITPHITEKSYRFISDDKKVSSSYTFKVLPDLDKDAIKKLVEKSFKVHVTGMQIINIPGKARRFKGKLGKTSATKKAIVRLKAGENIAEFNPDTARKEDKE
jgi:large subunit ribosomal protein L23